VIRRGIATFGDCPFLNSASASVLMQSKPVFLECPTCKAAIKGAAFACPECAAMYCIRCAIMKSERNEPCIKCNKHLQFG